MTRQSWFVFFMVVLAVIALDQWTKVIATKHLASQRLGHYLEFTVQEDTTVKDLLGGEFGANSQSELDVIGRKYVIDRSNRRLTAKTPLKAGETVFVTERKIVVIPGYFDLRYTRNPGAAFGVFADEDATWRIPFFAFMTLLSMIFFLAMARAMRPSQRLILLALALLMGGTVGNFIDRMAHGWVIDFIVWKYTEAYRWPTFNVADSAIVAGTGLVFLAIIQEARQSRELANAYVQAHEEEE